MVTCKDFFLFFAFAGLAMNTMAQADSIGHRIILLGDAGELTAGKQPNLELLQSVYPLNDPHTSVLYLGDNIYDYGLPDEPSATYEAMRNILQMQVDVVKGRKAQVFFVPGNHDWKKGKDGGWERLLNEYNYVQSLQLDNVHFVPPGGCPGPFEISLSDDVVLVVIDTQWWLHKYNKPGVTSDCDCKTTDEVITSLTDIVDRNRNKLLVYASHHPFKTYGNHGGFFSLRQHIFPIPSHPNFPLPVLGSLYTIPRSLGLLSRQDTRHPVNKAMIHSIDDVLSLHPYCIRVAGHDHNLQRIREKDNLYIVSGAAAKSNPVKRSGSLSLWTAKTTGFAVLEILKNGSVWIKYFSSQGEAIREPIFVEALRSFVPVKSKEAVATMVTFPDSVTAAGSPGYKAGGFKKFLLGANYRKEWREPVRVQVFEISKELGGLTPLQRGGGKQSKSLRLEASNGKQYVLRSVDKFPDKALPEELRETFAKNLVKDGISASYPYSGLSIPPLAAAANIPHANPKLVFVPDDPRLGMYQRDFANTLCLFEEREPGPVEKTYSTDKVLEKLKEDNDNQVDEKAVLKARLLDMFIMDFDRHEDQWRWGANDVKNGKSYFPIPRDRDQAFFINNGLLPSLASVRALVPQLQGFRAHAKNINGFNVPARNFDRSFLTGLSLEDWRSAAQELLLQLSDTAIEIAMHQQPAEIFKFSGDKIIQILKDRKNFLVQEAEHYYKFLSKEVTIVGSDKVELFDVMRNEDGSVLVTVYKINKEGEANKKLFERRFLPSETKEIRLFGLGADDKFVIHGDATKSIKLRVIGGTGNDQFTNSGSHTSVNKTVIYDLNSEKNEFNGKSKLELSPDPKVNQLDRKSFKYNILANFISASYNVDDGLYLGVSLKYTTHGFRKEPYKIMHDASINHAVATKAYNFDYKMEAIDVIGKGDLVFNGSIKAPNNTINFFGYGNESIYLKGKGDGIRFYRVRFNLADAALLVRANPLQGVSIAAGPSFQYFSMDREDNKNRLIYFPHLYGLDSATVYQRKTYAGIQLITGVDNRDSKILPTRGVNWQTSLRVNKGLNNAASDFSQLNSDLSLFTSFQWPARFVIATRVGGGINFGYYEFYQSQYLSGTANLRGFRKYRFAGDKMFYSNTEVRIKVTDIHTYLVPGALGILGFFDVGRVWLKGETSKLWHTGYGGGLWLAPLKRFVVTACYTASKEGGLPLISLGFQF